ncbi:PorP/SprF family type IX secretion system membrane protein [Tenacibaculum sp. IB213877]|uniref:PorP/SprF family type IX secretion system membrane protein n=1 Tax=Tenacibaculum sp. IB213877 TaxID=3097351 RepID=UPI002A59F921|nr:PorP/SprF family type IX secretion system membrane protein [Tenacibaculum sp. IB213877]MDY0779733.1 PorP/SprF family type IX secretion system membrane protein [Tenacibaculum sp. IB213877]
MVKRITLYILLLFTASISLAQTSGSGDEYNGFATRSFMKFNGFLTVPTFSVIHKNNQTIQALVRNSNIEFDDASRLHVLSYSGGGRENIGAGVAVFQQEVGVFKDFGAVANYAYQLQLGAESKLTFGFNFFYSRRGVDDGKVLSNGEAPILNNYQDRPAVVFQPAATVSFGKFYAGVFLENLADFNLKESEFITSFSEKTISAHLGYTADLDDFSGLLEGTTLRALGVARRSQEQGFMYAANVLADIPKAGWVKVGYDNYYGLNAGLGINLSDRLSIGFTYEKQKNLGATNEVGLIYNLGGKARRERAERTPISIKKPELEEEEEDDFMAPVDMPKPIKNVYEDPEHNDLSDELQIAQDSINILNKKVDQILKILKNQPKQVEIIREVPSNQPKEEASQSEEEMDYSLERSKATPWRQSTITRTGGGAGTMYYVAVDQFKDLAKARDLVKYYKKRDVKVRYVRDPKFDSYFVYIERYAKRKDAEEKVDEVNGGRKGFENDDEEDDLGIKVKKTTKDPVYVVKITLGAQGESYTEPKPQAPARVRTMKKVEGLEEGYYLQVSVNSKKAYADKFIDELRSDGIKANYFINPATGYRHVYILKTDSREEAIRLYKNNLNGTYYDRKNIINIR